MPTTPLVSFIGDTAGVSLLPVGAFTALSRKLVELSAVRGLAVEVGSVSREAVSRMWGDCVLIREGKKTSTTVLHVGVTLIYPSGSTFFPGGLIIEYREGDTPGEFEFVASLHT